MDGGILIACALSQEARLLRRFLGLAQQENASPVEQPGAAGDPSGPRRRPEIQVTDTGLGATRTGTCLDRLFRHRRPSRLIFAGTAGQLDPSLPMGFVAIPRRWKFEDGRRFDVSFPAEGLPEALAPSLVDCGLTVRRPVFRPSTRVRLHREFGASICDMESAAAGQAAQGAGVPFLAAKVVSDTAESSVRDFFRYFETNMEALAEALSRLISNSRHT